MFQDTHMMLKTAICNRKQIPFHFVLNEKIHNYLEIFSTVASDFANLKKYIYDEDI